MKKKTTAILLLLTEYATAQSASQKLGNIMATYLCNLTAAVKNIAGVIAVFVLIAAGAKWVWSKEDPGERKQAKSLIENVMTGLIIILAAGGIVYAIIQIAPCP